jgi:peroxiredoxin
MSVRWLVLLGLLACGGPGLLACGGVDPPPQAPFARKGDLVGGRLELVDGGELELASLRGRVVVVHFFDTLGLGTFTDVDELRAVRQAYPELVVVGVGLDPSPRLLAQWRDSERIDWFVARPSERILSRESVFGDVMAMAPSVVLVDRSGQVAWTWRGPLPKGELARHVASLERGR